MRKLISIGTSYPGRAVSDSNFVGNQQSVSNVNASHTLFGFAQPCGRKVN